MTKAIQTIISTSVAQKMYDLISDIDDPRNPEYLEDEEIIKKLHSIQDIPTEEIAKLTNYGVGTIRKVFDELREEYNVKSKTGLAAAYLRAELKKLKKQIDNILDV